MSEPTSPTSPSSRPSSAEPVASAEAAAIGNAWGAGLRPDPALTVSDWADRHRFLSSRAAAESGRYRTQRTPYMREIMDRLSPRDPAQRIVFMKAAQVGATEAGNNWIGYVIHHAPGPMLAVQPTVELAKRFSRQRLDPLIADSPVLRERVAPQRARDAGNTMLAKEFPAGLLVLTGANSAVGLRSMPARYLFLDEVDAYPPRPTQKAIRSRWRKRAPAPSRGAPRCSSPRRRRSRASRASSASSRRRTSAATSCRARSAGRCNGSDSNGCAGRRASPPPPATTARAARRRSPSTTKRRCWPAASGARPPRRLIRRRSAITSPASTRRWAGSPGNKSRGCGKGPPPTRPGGASRTASLARPGSKAARRPTGSASTSGASPGGWARCRAAACS